MRILVTGGEGLVGSAVVANLLDAGHALTTLTLPGVTPHDGVRVVRGDARDVEAVRDALAGVDAVAHLAAHPHPRDHPAPVVFSNNTHATFTVLWTAAEAGVRRFAIASSVNAAGLLMNPFGHLPDRYPVDERVKVDLADPYSLSKHTDEFTLHTVCRRFGASGVALRLPLMVSPELARDLRAWAAGAPESGAADGWGWLDTRDGAEAFRLALVGDYVGSHVVHVAARTTFQDVPTEELLDRYAPGVPRARRFEDRRAPIDTANAERLLGFRPRFDDPPHSEPREI
jgi:nucleoside-diphosphate-sugar epimerase